MHNTIFCRLVYVGYFQVIHKYTLYFSHNKLDFSATLLEWKMYMVKNRIKEIRKKYRITLEQLSELSGLSISAINDIENGIHIPNQDSMLLISKGLAMSTQSVFRLDWENMDL